MVIFAAVTENECVIRDGGRIWAVEYYNITYSVLFFFQFNCKSEFIMMIFL